ncbi:MAG: hypothetical protein H6838_00425 [Planctomycetes bacterium]|nr:hypothetical protein [Planctomycetota bacterium]MCB9883919.1 hypothetical protein [Planctomycetota bacterium]
MKILPRLVPLLLCLLPACSGGGGSAGGNAAASPSPIGSVHVVVDPATGSDKLVQFQVAAAALERGDGSTTGNLLRSPQMLTLADPSGELAGLTLTTAPTGTYTNLHLMLAPGSGMMLRGDGSSAPVNGPVDLIVPIMDGLAHDASGRTWVALGHRGEAPPANGGVGVQWNPSLIGRASGSEGEFHGLRVAAVDAAGVTTLWTLGDDGPLQVGFSATCQFRAEDGNAIADRNQFMSGLDDSCELRVRGRLSRDGRVEGDVVERSSSSRGNNNARLIGRITELRPLAESFWMDVYAEARRGSHQILSTPRRALVSAQGARIHRSNSRDVLVFGDLNVGQLAKVEWTTRTLLGNGDEEVTADEIEVTSGNGAPMRPEWEGRVQSVDLVLGTITVVPRGNDPIVVRGQSVNQVTVQTDANTYFERRQRQGPGRAAIQLDDIVAGSDRIWWRGTVTGPTDIDAVWVRVRDDS